MSLKYVSAYLLANVAGVEKPTVEQITKIVEAAGGKADKEAIETLVSQLGEKNITETIVSGKTKLFSTAFVAAAPSAGGKSASPAKGPAAAKAPEPEEEEEGAAFDLFD
jgi:ribosomal protein L12E/L44/L45/RPP1/RPP2